MVVNDTAKQMKKNMQNKHTIQKLTNKHTSFQVSYRQPSENNTRVKNRYLVYTRTYIQYEIN